MNLIEYTESGDVLDKSGKGRPKKCVAKVEEYRNRTGYFILTSKTDDFFDPLNKTREKMKFAKVPKLCFEQYLSYLQTKNKAYFEGAKRNRLANEQPELVEPKDKESTDSQHSVQLSKADKSYIEENAHVKSLDDLVKDIGKPRPLVQEYVEYMKRGTARKLLDQSKPGITVLTKEAAEHADKTMGKNPKPKTDKSTYIFKIRN